MSLLATSASYLATTAFVAISASILVLVIEAPSTADCASVVERLRFSISIS